MSNANFLWILENLRGGAGLGLEVRWMEQGADVDVAVVGGAASAGPGQYWCYDWWPGTRHHQ